MAVAKKYAKDSIVCIRKKQGLAKVIEGEKEAWELMLMTCHETCGGLREFRVSTHASHQ